jgi:NAD(P)-dependent dehydrogenase (short-subunit alcohol dehydrogenase family)
MYPLFERIILVLVSVNKIISTCTLYRALDFPKCTRKRIRFLSSFNTFHKIKSNKDKNKTKKIVTMSLSGKNIIITGATSGLGLQAAALFSNEGASVFFGGRRTNQGAVVAEQTKTTFHTLDAADEKSNEKFFSAAADHFGGSEMVDYIFLNAGVEGIYEETRFDQLSIENADYIYNVNVRGVLLGIKHGISLLRKNGGFVATSSVASILPVSRNPVYAASKAAVDGLVRGYAGQFTESNDDRIKSLSIVTVNPVFYTTEMSDRFTGGNPDIANMRAKAINPCQRPGTGEEFAKVLAEYIRGTLHYKSGDHVATDADTHFLLSEYFDRMKSVPVTQIKP